MSEPTIVCPNCRTEIKLNESLAAPLIEATRKQYEQKIALKDSEISKREIAIREQKENLTKEKEALEEEVSVRLIAERERISAEEIKKAKHLAARDLEQKVKEVAELQQILLERDAKLSEAQKAQADLIRKQRELDDAKREIDLTVEKRIQESLTSVRDKAKLEAEEGLKLRVLEKEEQISSMQRQIEELRRRAE